MNTLNNHGIELSVSVNGRPARTYLHESKYFIESREGTEYAIEVKNNNWYRVEVVTSVDGLSVLTGKTASASDSGYIINGRDKIVIKGFRKDKTEVGAFKFTKKEASYAASKGEGSNVGVIGIAVYKEKQPEYLSWIAKTSWTGGVLDNDLYWQPITTTLPKFRCSSNTGGQSAGGTLRAMAMNAVDTQTQYCNQVVAAQNVSFDHGTTWGTKIQDKVVNVEFLRDSAVPVVAELYYNSRENLETLGIKFIQEKQVTFPKGFPADFATPPPGWTG